MFSKKTKIKKSFFPKKKHLNTFKKMNEEKKVVHARNEIQQHQQHEQLHFYENGIVKLIIGCFVTFAVFLLIKRFFRNTKLNSKLSRDNPAAASSIYVL